MLSRPASHLNSLRTLQTFPDEVFVELNQDMSLSAFNWIACRPNKDCKLQLAELALLRSCVYPSAFSTSLFFFSFCVYLFICFLLFFQFSYFFLSLSPSFFLYSLLYFPLSLIPVFFSFFFLLPLSFLRFSLLFSLRPFYLFPPFLPPLCLSLPPLS